MPKRPEPEGIVVVLRADERGARAEGSRRTVDVGMHQVGVDDFWPVTACETHGTDEKCRVEVTGSRETVVGDAEAVELSVERVWLAVVEAEKTRVHSAAAEGRQQCQ